MMQKARTLLAALTVASCLPYLTLKLTWMSGGTPGIPEGSPLLDSDGTLWLLNAVTVAMDATVILLVFVLTRAWGRRLPAALLALPLWAATGLLGPIMVAFPVQALYGAVSGGSSGGSDTSGAGAQGTLDGWVWTVVYTGFTIQALALGALFVLYVRERWGPLLRTRLGALAVPPRIRAVWQTGFAVAAPLALASAVPHLLWAAGVDAGLSAQRSADRSADSQITEAAFALFVLLAVVGLARLVLADERRDGPRLRTPLAAAWVGSGVMTCWGAWLLMGALTGGGSAVGQRATGFMELAYAGQMLGGLLLTLLGAHVLRQFAGARAASAAGRTGVAGAAGEAGAADAAPGAAEAARGDQRRPSV